MKTNFKSVNALINWFEIYLLGGTELIIKFINFNNFFYNLA